ncbi:MAG TPA: histidine phosphatase family protein [Rhodobacteraceae bacterium]|nr:histidine phosphatase family protein [Paracoccaceae bacterium]
MNISHPFYFLRHGQTQWNKDRIVQGQTDSPLNDIGCAQAETAARVLADEPIARIIASPLSRTKHTAEAVAAKTGLEVTYDDDLMECNLGDHQGEPYGDWIPHYWNGTYAPPNGETFQAFCNRVWNAMQKAIRLGPNTLIVAHGGLWIAAQEYVSMQPPMRLPNNALPLSVTPKGRIWAYEILGAESVI